MQHVDLDAYGPAAGKGPRHLCSRFTEHATQCGPGDLHTGRGSLL